MLQCRKDTENKIGDEGGIMSYRPKDWKNPHRLELSKPCLNKELPEEWQMEPRYSAYEAGADAMLEALINDRPLITPEQMR